jgi:hypothetical protein
MQGYSALSHFQMTKTAGRPPGRPPKEGEVFEAGHRVKFAPSVMARLEKIRDETKVSISAQVRKFVDEGFSRQDAKKDVQFEEIRQTVRDALKEELAQGVSLNLSDSETSALKRLTAALGREDHVQIAEALIRSAISLTPDEVDEFINRRLIQQYEREREAGRAQPKSKRVA